MKRFLPILILISGLLFCVSLKAQTVAEPRLIADSALCIEVETGRVLFAKNIEKRRPVASTQKLLTALLVAEKGKLDESVTVAATDMKIEPRNLWITTGSKYKRRKLLEMMLVRSYNDVTKCLARDHSGSQVVFASAMNKKAKELGMNNSYFTNPHGLTAVGQYSTALDMMRLAQFAYANPEIREMAKIKNTDFTYHGGKTIPIKNSNELLFSYPECSGLKTGYTKAAGRCLVCAAERNGKVVLAVVLGSTMEAIWRDSKALLDYSLESLERGVDLDKYKVSAQKWASDIAGFNKLDQSLEESKESILFVGGSTIGSWGSIGQAMAPYDVISRGLSGGGFSDLAVYSEQIINPHKFRGVVLTGGENLKGNSDDPTTDEVVNLFLYVCNKITDHNSKVPVFYVAATPTEAKKELWDKRKAINSAIRKLCVDRPNTFFIGTESLFLDKEGNPRGDLFTGDQLNAKGYDLWSAAIKSHLDVFYNGAFQPVRRGWQMPRSEY